MAYYGQLDKFDIDMAVRYDPDTTEHAWQYGNQAIEDFFGPDPPGWSDDLALAFHGLNDISADRGEMILGGYHADSGELSEPINVSTTLPPNVGHAGSSSGSGISSNSVGQMQPDINVGEEQVHPSQSIFGSAFDHPTGHFPPIAPGDPQLFAVLNENFHGPEPMQSLGSDRDVPASSNNHDDGEQIVGSQYPMPGAIPPVTALQENNKYSSLLPGQHLQRRNRPHKIMIPEAHIGGQYPHKYYQSDPYSEPVAATQASSHYPSPPNAPFTPSLSFQAAQRNRLFSSPTPYLRGRHTRSTEGAESLRHEMRQQQASLGTNFNAIPFPDPSTLTASSLENVGEATERGKAAIEERRKRKHDSGDNNNDSDIQFKRPLASEASPPVRRRKLGSPFQSPPPKRKRISNPYDMENAPRAPTEDGTMRVAAYVQIPKPVPESVAGDYMDFSASAPAMKDSATMTDPLSGTSEYLPVRTKSRRATQKDQPNLLGSTDNMISDTARVGTPATNVASDTAIGSEPARRRKRGSHPISNFETHSLMNDERFMTPDNTQVIGRRTTRRKMGLDDLLATGPNAGQAAKKRHSEK